MQNRDITEILKVFEKRITKLEKKVGELEATVDDLNDSSTIKEKQVDVEKKTEEEFVEFKTLDSRFDELSVEKRARPKKVTYDKNVLLSIKPAASVDSELTEHTDMERSLSIDLLEEGEVYEPLPMSPTALSVDRHKDQKEFKSDNRRRQSRDKKSQSPRQSTNSSNKATGRERAKSEPMMETLRSMKREVEFAPPPTCKSEVHYGLLVQYPPEDDK